VLPCWVTWTIDRGGGHKGNASQDGPDWHSGGQMMVTSHHHVLWLILVAVILKIKHDVVLDVRIKVTIRKVS